MPVLCIMATQTKDDHKKGNINMTLFTENKTRLEIYQEASKYP